MKIVTDDKASELTVMLLKNDKKFVMNWFKMMMILKKN